MRNQTTVNRTFIVKAGMTPQDVINSKEATLQQKKMAYAFDSDGKAGYSKREADVFNATLITNRGQNGVSLWTRYKDGSMKETRYSGDISKFKFAPKGDVKPYVIAKDKQAKPTATQQASFTAKAKSLPPLTQVDIVDTLAFYSKQDSIAYNAKYDAAYAKYKQADDAAYTKYKQAKDAAYAKYVQAEDAAYTKYRQADDAKMTEAIEEWTVERIRAKQEWRATDIKVGQEWKAAMSRARQELAAAKTKAIKKHCSQVRKYQPKN